MANRGQLRVDVTGDSTSWQRTLAEVRMQAKSFADRIQRDTWTGMGKSFAGGIIGALSFESIKGHIEKLFARGSEIADTTEQFDLSSDAVQRWEKAVSRASLSTMTFYRALDMLREKRQAANNPKDMALFTALGITPNEIYNPKFSDIALLEKVLRSGNRAAIGDVLGPRGARLVAALKDYDQLAPGVAFSAADLKEMKQSEQKILEAKGKFHKWSLRHGLGRAALFFSELAEGKWAEAFQSAQAMGTSGNLVDMWKRLTGKAQVKLDITSGATIPKPKAIDPKEEERLRERQATAEERLRDAQRRLMTDEKRREEIRREVTTIDTDIATMASKHLDGEGRIKLLELMTRRASLMEALKMTPLRERPFSVQPDAAARMGLYSEATANYNPVVNIAAQQLTQLRVIARNTANYRDPHKL